MRVDMDRAIIFVAELLNPRVIVRSIRIDQQCPGRILPPFAHGQARRTFVFRDDRRIWLAVPRRWGFRFVGRRVSRFARNEGITPIWSYVLGALSVLVRTFI